MKPVTMTIHQWQRLEKRLQKDYRPSVTLIRPVMKLVLGFTTRRENYYDTNENRYKRLVHLDFFNEKKRTFFLLKYTDYVNEE